MNNFKRVTIAVGAIFSFVLLGSSTALAAPPLNTLPTGDSLYMVDADGGAGIFEMTATGEEKLLDLQLNDSAGGYIAAGALNQTDLHAYTVYVAYDTNECSLDKIDLLGGAPAARIPIKHGTTALGECDGINIDAEGNALIHGTDDGGGTYSIWTLDLTTGLVTNPVNIETALYGFTKNPTNGTWYGIAPDGTLVSIDPTSGTFTTLVTHTLNDAFDAKFDSSGTLWFTNEEGAAPYQLYSWRAGDTDYTLQGDTSLDGDTAAGAYGPVFVGYSTETLTDKKDEGSGSSSGTETATPAAQAPTLPNTGADGVLIMGATSLAILSILGGVAFLIYSRRRA